MKADVENWIYHLLSTYLILSLSRRLLIRSKECFSTIYIGSEEHKNFQLLLIAKWGQFISLGSSFAFSKFKTALLLLTIADVARSHPILVLMTASFIIDTIHVKASLDDFEMAVMYEDIPQMIRQCDRPKHRSTYDTNDVILNTRKQAIPSHMPTNKLKINSMPKVSTLKRRSQKNNCKCDG